MSGEHQFMPWLRRGMGVALSAPEGAERAKVTVRLEVNEQVATHEFLVAGPQDVRGFEASAVLHTWPRADVMDAPPGFLPLIEFKQADLPWRYTPSAPDGVRLNPWLCLVVLSESEIGAFYESTGEQPFAIVQVTDQRRLLLLDDAWAWAHVHALGTSDHAVTASNVGELLAQEPDRFVARLLAPRVLAPRTTYRAMLVPTHAWGAAAGLGRERPAGSTLRSPAWANEAGPVTLPVYYSWRFGTGTGERFETMVRRLRTRALPSSVGTRRMDTRNAAARLPGVGPTSAATGPMELEAALQPMERNDPPGPMVSGAFVALLTAILNDVAERRSADAPAILGPPLYGQWYAMREGLGPTDAPAGLPTGWLASLNLDPRNRVAAGMGTRVVQARQQALLASAWRQLEGIRAINETLRQTQLSRQTSLRIHARQLAPLGPEALLSWTAPLHGHVLHGETPVAGVLAGSAIPAGLFEGSWRRLTRPTGRVAHRLRRSDPRASAEGLVGRFNQGEFREPPALTGAIATPQTLAQVLQSLASAAEPGARPMPLPLDTPFPLALLAALSRVPTDGTGRRDTPLLDAALEELRAGRRDMDPESLRGVVEEVLGAPTDDYETARRRESLQRFLSLLATPQEPGPVVRSLDLEALQRSLLAGLHPERTFAESLATRLSVSSRLDWHPEDPLEPILAAPEFPQPMYEALRDLSQEWILPGLDKVPADTVAMVKTNRRFIEAYLVGLNHEMARELLWQGYPTDRRGSYFRQFWDVGVPRDTPEDAPLPESVRDVAPLHGWRRESGLGSHPSAGASTESAFDRELPVLLLRSELLRQYPNLLVYLQRGEEIARPTFQGRLPPDVGFFGFPLSRSDLAAREGRTPYPPWQFVLEEQVTEVRFAAPLHTPPGPASIAQLLGSAPTADVSAATLARRILVAPVRVTIPAWFLFDPTRTA